jgi:hypothetical protein
MMTEGMLQNKQPALEGNMQTALKTEKSFLRDHSLHSKDSGIAEDHARHFEGLAARTRK